MLSSFHESSTLIECQVNPVSGYLCSDTAGIPHVCTELLETACALRNVLVHFCQYLFTGDVTLYLWEWRSNCIHAMRIHF